MHIVKCLTTIYSILFCSEPGAHPRPVGAQHLHLQPQDVPGDRRAFKTCRAVDQQQEGGLL